MEQAMIHHYVNASKNMVAKGTPQSIPMAFSLLYTAFEGLQNRILVVVAHRCGWLVADAESVLSDFRTWDNNRTFEDRFRAISKQSPILHPDAEQFWHAALGARFLRNKVVHGAKTPSVRLVAAAHRYLAMVIESIDRILFGMEIAVTGGQRILVGSPMSRLKRKGSRQATYRPKQELEDALWSRSKKPHKMDISKEYMEPEFFEKKLSDLKSLVRRDAK